MTWPLGFVSAWRNICDAGCLWDNQLEHPRDRETRGRFHGGNVEIILRLVPWGLRRGRESPLEARKTPKQGHTSIGHIIILADEGGIAQIRMLGNYNAEIL